jgi:hypothetical protein
LNNPGQRVLVQHRLKPTGLPDQLLLEDLGPRRRAHAREQLDRYDRLEQEVLRAAPQLFLAGLHRDALTDAEDHCGGEDLRVALELVEERDAAPVPGDVGVDERHLGPRLAACRQRGLGIGGLDHAEAELLERGGELTADVW